MRPARPSRKSRWTRLGWAGPGRAGSGYWAGRPVSRPGVYAPDSRSWNWQNLSTFVSDNCVIFGDFNVDLEQDGNKAESLLDWADSLN